MIRRIMLACLRAVASAPPGARHPTIVRVEAAILEAWRQRGER
jgi:hypothetical protein